MERIIKIFMLTLNKRDVPDFIDSLIGKGFSVIAPVNTEKGPNFLEVKRGRNVATDYINTVYPPKRFFLPDGETLFSYDLKGNPKIREDVEKVDRVIFGIRPCDVHGLLDLDLVLGKDPYYMRRRKGTLLIAVNCALAGENCFCQSMGTDKLKEGYDLLLSDCGDRLAVEGCSKRGKTLVNEFFKESAVEKKKMANKRKFGSRKIEKRILKVFDDKAWEDLAEKCLSCGACTVVCPTCYCFGIRDEPGYDRSGERKRVWSFCMLREFSRVAGDVVFRRDRTERCKQFVFHKLSYFMEEHGKQLCVGCGRCVDVCPTGIDFFRETEGMIRKAEGRDK